MHSIIEKIIFKSLTPDEQIHFIREQVIYFFRKNGIDTTLHTKRVNDLVEVIHAELIKE